MFPDSFSLQARIKLELNFYHTRKHSTHSLVNPPYGGLETPKVWPLTGTLVPAVLHEHPNVVDGTVVDRRSEGWCAAPRHPLHYFLWTQIASESQIERTLPGHDLMANNRKGVNIALLRAPFRPKRLSQQFWRCPQKIWGVNKLIYNYEGELSFLRRPLF